MVMPSCREIDPLVTPYVDGAASPTERASVDAHVAACPPCRQRAEAERAVRETLQARVAPLSAPDHLRERCRRAAAIPAGPSRIHPRLSLALVSMAAALVL